MSLLAVPLVPAAKVLEYFWARFSPWGVLAKSLMFFAMGALGDDGVVEVVGAVVVVVVAGGFFLVFFAVPGWPRTRVTGEKARKKRRRRRPAPSGNVVDCFMIADFSFCESIADIGGFV
jgi:hypothetical protein